ncbi:MOSC domain-containing protein [Paracoccus liaowanqingii]|uniref:MOSC domain-containing protein n=1 Tax=Paracoccus liaowanqingii TaxID=2560053 RepID=A0A4Z1CQY4_9RHOB|nr:MOSC domain-containing protein [Paracoccus liaowanqingii]TGN67537.1 MOSC domain-containing protein [Paracoccus liaowanqingii]
MNGTVVEVAKSRTHRFSKNPAFEILLVEGLGVAGDAHQGATVKHRSRVAADPTQPNLRQVHLIHSELFKELADKGFQVQPADLGENITTTGLDLLALPQGTILCIGHDVELVVTGLRNPCIQIDKFQKGLVGAVLDKGANGRLVRKSGIMAVVKTGGIVRKGDEIGVVEPPLPHKALKPV